MVKHASKPTPLKQPRINVRKVKHNVSDGPRGQCDRCGFDYPLKELKKDWQGFMVCPKDFDLRHPQLDLRVHPEDWSVRNARPRNVAGVRSVGYVKKEDLFR